MPQKKKKYNARFPPGRIKKIMQTDEEVGKVAAAVPIMISRTLELFVESLLIKTMEITNTRQARTLTPSHMRQCIMSESRFDFLRELVKDIPNMSWNDDFQSGGESGGAIDATLPVPVSPAPTAIMPAHGGHSNGNSYNTITSQTSGVMDRPRRSYTRPVSYDESSDGHNYMGARPSSSRDRDYQSNDSPTGILKRKLLDLSRKYVSSDGSHSSKSYAPSGHGKLARMDSSPAAFSDQRMNAREPLSNRRRRSNDSTKASFRPELPMIMSPLPPTLNTGSISSPVIKIDYNQPAAFSVLNGPGSALGSPEITPVINIDFSNLVSPTAGVASNGGSNKLSLSTAVDAKANTGLATPNLTTPTQLNFVVPPFQAAPVAATVPGFPPAIVSALEMDEDYDDI